MLANTIRNFFILTVAIYSFYKLLNLNFLTKKTAFFLIFSSLITSIISSRLCIPNLSLNWFFIMLLFFLLMKISTKLRSPIIYVTTLFSFALSFITFNISGLIAALILLPFHYGNYELSWIFIRILGGVIHFLLLYFCFRIPRLKRGMTFLYNAPSNNIGSVFCLFTIMSVIILCQSKTFNERFTVSIWTIIFIFGFLLIYWWNYHITQTYRKYLKENEIHTLNLLLEEKIGK